MPNKNTNINIFVFMAFIFYSQVFVRFLFVFIFLAEGGFFEIFINRHFQDSEKFSNFSRYFHGHRKMAPKRSQTYRSLRCDDRLLSDDDGSRCVHGQNCQKTERSVLEYHVPEYPKKKVPKGFNLPALLQRNRLIYFRSL